MVWCIWQVLCSASQFPSSFMWIFLRSLSSLFFEGIWQGVDDKFFVQHHNFHLLSCEFSWDLYLHSSLRYLARCRWQVLCSASQFPSSFLWIFLRSLVKYFGIGNWLGVGLIGIDYVVKNMAVDNEHLGWVRTVCGMV